MLYFRPQVPSLGRTVYPQLILRVEERLGLPGVGLLSAAIALVFAATLHSVGLAATSDGFDHEQHAHLFPSCTGCHEPGKAGLYTINQQGCAACHDGDELDVVEWVRPQRPADNVKFDHDTHPSAFLESGEKSECAACHQRTDSSPRMQIVTPTSTECLVCHEEDPEQHFTPGTPCQGCHVDLTVATDLSIERVANFPQPGTHEADDFLRTHRGLAELHPEACAICHARESCERCHANAGQVPQIQELERDARVAVVASGLAGKWFTPESHSATSWWAAHGGDPDNCSNCHSESSCSGCHTKKVARLEVLPMPSKAGMPTLSLIPLDHTENFVTEHAGAAALRDCSTCHVEEFCTDCHQGQRAVETAAGGYHPPNFVLHHAASAFGPSTECSDCHSTEVFCRDCHMQSGLAPVRSRSSSYHDAELFWLLSHGEAARQGLDKCATCHQQSDCLRCHSGRTGWGVSPHGPDFNADALSEANKVMCLTCHPRSFVGRL